MTIQVSLQSLLNDLDVYDPGISFGSDIDATHAEMFDSTTSSACKKQAFLNWVARYQPCLFGRMGAKGVRGIGIDMCWLDEQDINLGDIHITDKIQYTRRAWKDRAAEGLAHGFLIMFSHSRLAFARPGRALVTVCQRVSDLYLVEHAPIECDVIYTEAIPLRGPEGHLSLFKAGINIFYPAAHRTLNHDRRIPGGVMISVNSPGHYANSLVFRGLSPSLDLAVEQVMNLTLRSIGHGGIGHPNTKSTSWHNRETDSAILSARCPMKSLSAYIPGDHSRRTYSALYHTDVLVPTDVTLDSTLDPDTSSAEVWSHLILDYVTAARFPEHHVNYGLFHGHPISEEARYHNPWPLRRAYNAPLANY